MRYRRERTIDRAPRAAENRERHSTYPSASTRLRVLLAALVSFVLVAAGAMASLPAHAAAATVAATVSSADTTGLTVQVRAEGCRT